MSISFRLQRHDSLQMESWTYYPWCILWLLKIILKGVLASLGWDLSTPLPLFAICIDQVGTEWYSLHPLPFTLISYHPLDSDDGLLYVCGWINCCAVGGEDPSNLLVSIFSCSGHHTVWDFHSFRICMFSKLVVCSCVLTFLLFCILIGWSYHFLSFSAWLTLQGRGETAIQ